MHRFVPKFAIICPLSILPFNGLRLRKTAHRDFPDEKKDHLSELPDDILVRILSLLPYTHVV